MEGAQITQVPSMAHASPRNAVPATTAVEVELEVRLRGAKPRVYNVPEAGFLVGSVAGCDMRLPGNELPPVICLITRGRAGAEIRRLAPMFPILINGAPSTKPELKTGDRLTLADTEVVVHVSPASENLTRRAESPQAPAAEPAHLQATPQSGPTPAEQELDRRQQALAENEAQLDTFAQELAREKEELEEVRRAIQEKELKLNQERQTLATRAEQVTRQQQELTALGKQLADVRTQLHNRYASERDRLTKLQAALKAGATKLKERQHALAEDERGSGKAEVEAQRQQQEELYRQRRDRLAWLQQKIRRAARKVREGRRQLDENRRQLQGALEGCKGYRAEIETAAIELAKHQEALDQREKVLQNKQATREAELATRLAACAEKEKHAAEQAEANAHTATQLQDGMIRYQRQLAAVGEKERQLDERAVALEQRGQILHSDTRELEEQAKQLEAWDASLCGESEAFAKQKLAQDSVAQELTQRAAALDEQQANLASLRTRMERGRELLRQEEQQFAEVRERQQGTADEVQRLVDVDRRDLQERELRLVQTEQSLAVLQEKLRRRSEDLAAQERAHVQESTRLAQKVAGLGEQQRQIDQQSAERVRASEERADELARLHDELHTREARWQKNAERLKEAGRVVSAARRLLAQEKQQLEAQRRDAAAEHLRRGEERHTLEKQIEELAGRLPELEEQAQAAVERLTDARRRLREHLTEVHNYAGRARGDLNKVRDQVHADIEQLRRQQADHYRARDEHNLAVAEFRQQSLLAQASAAGEGLKHGKVAPEREAAGLAPSIGSEAAVLSEAATMGDGTSPEMRAWYKQKLRAITETAPQDRPKRSGGGSTNPRPDILSITGNVPPADRKLGDLLLSLDLIDNETLDALLIESHKQRRPLRQALLSGGCLSLYQLALIEAGNLEALALGPVFPIDRIRATPRETVYRVHDPRRQADGVLRHLSEAEMHEPGHADQFRECFGQAARLAHPNMAATWEMLEVHDRPAALQEAVAGLTAADWPELINVPGVWFRLVCQAALGLKTAHELGLVHGHLDSGNVLLTRDGTLKLSGFGEPGWLNAPQIDSPMGVREDLQALGALASQWAGAMSPRRGTRGRSATAAIRDILSRLEPNDGVLQFESASELLDALEQVGDKLPANAAAWDRLVQHIRDHAAEGAAVRQTA
jgi:hypothetical protein